MSPSAAPAHTPSADRIVRYALRALVAAWAGFWLWFVAATLLSEPSLAGLQHGGGLALVVVTVAASAWRFPRIGGTLLILGGAFAHWYFPSQGARLLLALPAAVLGIGFLLTTLPWRGRPTAPANTRA